MAKKVYTACYVVKRNFSINRGEKIRCKASLLVIASHFSGRAESKLLNIQYTEEDSI